MDVSFTTCTDGLQRSFQHGTHPNPVRLLRVFYPPAGLLHPGLRGGCPLQDYALNLFGTVIVPKQAHAVVLQEIAVILPLLIKHPPNNTDMAQNGSYLPLHAVYAISHPTSQSAE